MKRDSTGTPAPAGATPGGDPGAEAQRGASIPRGTDEESGVHSATSTESSAAAGEASAGGVEREAPPGGVERETG